MLKKYTVGAEGLDEPNIFEDPEGSFIDLKDIAARLVQADTGKANPVFEVPRDLVIDIVQAIAEQAMPGHTLQMIQTDLVVRPSSDPAPTEIPIKNGKAFWWDAPSIVFMLSNWER